MTRYRSGIAETRVSSSARVSGLICLTRLDWPPPRTRHGFAAISSSATAVFRAALAGNTLYRGTFTIRINPSIAHRT